jgi:hypothetical protein
MNTDVFSDYKHVYKKTNVYKKWGLTTVVNNDYNGNVNVYKRKQVCSSNVNIVNDDYKRKH